MATVTSTASARALLERLGVDPALVADGDLLVRTPITGEEIGRVARTTEAEHDGSRLARGRRLRRVARHAGAATR